MTQGRRRERRRRSQERAGAVRWPRSGTLWLGLWLALAAVVVVSGIWWIANRERTPTSGPPTASTASAEKDHREQPPVRPATKSERDQPTPSTPLAEPNPPPVAEQPMPTQGEADLPQLAGLPHQQITISHIVDGDTVDDGSDRRIRLIGINTPERGYPLYKEATALTARLVQGKTLILAFDKDRKDRYGRALGYLFATDGTFINREIVRLGLAYCYTFKPNNHFEAELLEAMREARDNHLGLWALTEPSPEPYYISEKRQVRFHRPSCERAAKLLTRKHVLRFDSRNAAFDTARCPCPQCKP